MFSWTDLKCRGKTHISWKVAFSLQGGWCLILIVPCSHRGHPKYLTMQHTLSLLNRASPGGVFTAVYARTKGAKAPSNSQGSLRLLSCRTASPQDSTPPITLSSSSFMEDQQGPCPLPPPPLPLQPVSIIVLRHKGSYGLLVNGSSIQPNFSFRYYYFLSSFITLLPSTTSLGVWSSKPTGPTCTAGSLRLTLSGPKELRGGGEKSSLRTRRLSVNCGGMGGGGEEIEWEFRLS